MISRRRIIYVRPFVGEIQPNDLHNVSDELSIKLEKNEILCEAEYIGIEAGLKTQALQYPHGITMIGSQIAKIIDSKNPRFPIGSYVYGKFGWQTHTVTNPDENCFNNNDMTQETPYILPDLGDNSRALALSCLGLTGNTALYGLFDILKPKSGECICISSATGAVGHLVTQMAKQIANGCRVIGIAGNEKKCQWLKNELNVDEAINYNSKEFLTILKQSTPNGIDCYFDLVGGELSASILTRMNTKGRIAVCGNLANLNLDPFNLPKISDTSRLISALQLQIHGFDTWQWSQKKWINGIAKNVKYLNEKSIKYYGKIIEDDGELKTIPETFAKLLSGQYIGGVIIKINKNKIK